MNCPNCNKETDYLYSRGPYNGNTDTTDYCNSCNPSLAEDIENTILNLTSESDDNS
jgi:hypothetical protein